MRSVILALVLGALAVLAFIGLVWLKGYAIQTSLPGSPILTISIDYKAGQVIITDPEKQPQMAYSVAALGEKVPLQSDNHFSHTIKLPDPKYQTTTFVVVQKELQKVAELNDNFFSIQPGYRAVIKGAAGIWYDLDSVPDRLDTARHGNWLIQIYRQH